MKFLDQCQSICFQCLHSPTYFWAKILNGLIAFLVILSVAVIPLHFIPGIEWLKPSLILFDKIAVTFFTVEYFLRIWSAPKPFKYIFSWWGLVDLLAILPFYLYEFGIISHPEIFMALRLLRLFKLGKIYDLERKVIAKNATDKHGQFQVFNKECIEYVVQKHWICFVTSLVFCISLITTALIALILVVPLNFWIGAGIALFLLVIATFLFLKLWLDFNYDLIYVTNKRIILQQRELFGARLNEVSYHSVTNVIPNDTSIWHWIFKFGDIKIETAAAQGTLIFKNATHPRIAVNHISENRLKVLAERSNIELQTQQN